MLIVFVVLKTLVERLLISACKLFGFADTFALSKFTILQFNDLSQTISSLHLARNHKQLGLTPRYVDIAYYNANAGLVNLYLFSSITADPQNGIDYNTPVYNFGATQTGLPGMAFTSMFSALGRSDKDRRYLDLQRRGVISRTQLRAEVALLPQKWDDPDVSVSPAHR